VAITEGLWLLSRDECGLCDEMIRALAAAQLPVELPPLQLADVDSDPLLQRRYGLHIPVLLLDGVEICRHRLDLGELTRLLRQR
jgi:hypothetical protein